MVGELVWLDEVDATDLSGVFAELVRDQVYGALGDIGGLRATSTAIGIGGYLICKNDIGTEVDRNIVSAAGDRQAESDHDDIGENLAVSTHVGDAMNLQTGDAPLFRCGDFDVVNLPAPVNGDSEILIAFLDPFDRASQLHGGEGGNHLFGIEVELGSEAAAHFWYDYAHLMLWQTKL